jgi:hypothetical protein
MTTECLDEIERLQSELQHFHKLTRKLVRQKLDLESELAALKTPRPCQDCHWFVPEEDDVPNCCGGDALIGVIEDPEHPWLCGHFKAKGTATDGMAELNKRVNDMHQRLDDDELMKGGHA